MITVFLRTVILYISMIFAMRIMGKKQVGELQPGELVVSIAISDLASIPMQDTDQPLLSGLIPIITLMCLEVCLSFLTLKSRFIRDVFSGRPCIVISHGIIDEKALSRLRYSISDLTEELRTAGCSDVRDVEYAVLETTGTLNIIPRAAKRPLTPSDLCLNVKPSDIMITVIADGRLIKESLVGTGRDEAWLKSELYKNHISDYSEVFYAAVSGSELYVQPKKRKERKNK